jgi:hypothetical protein
LEPFSFLTPYLLQMKQVSIVRTRTLAGFSH